MSLETPTIASSVVMANAFGLNNLQALGNAQQQLGNASLLQYLQQAALPPKAAITPPLKKETKTMANRRLVQVFIADPDENLPVDKSMIYSGDQRFTDLTDQELFFEIDIKTLLDKHNAERVKTINKSVKERSEYLEPARIRDLKMVVVNIASF